MALSIDFTNSTQLSNTSINATAFSVGTNFIANTTQVTIAAGIPLSANGGVGSATQVLTSNGATGSPYWAAVTIPSYVVNTSGNFTVAGNLSFTGTNTYFSTASYYNTSIIFTGNTTTSPTITLANTGSFTIGNSTTTQTTSTIVVANSTGNVQITPGTASILATGSVNAASYTVSTSFIANSTAIVGTGYANVTTSVNSALLTVGTVFVANTTTLNANGVVINSTAGFFTGYVNASAFTTTGNANAASHYSGANALFASASLSWTGNTTTSPTITLANTGNFVIGNSTTTQTTSTIVVANSTGNVQITPGTASILATGSVNAASYNAGANLVLNNTNLLWTGNTTTSPTITLPNTGAFTIGNSTTTQTAATISVANSTGNVRITAGTTSILATGIVNATTHSAGPNVGFTNASFLFTGNTTTSPTITIANTGAFTVGNSTTTQTGGSILIANSIGNVAISVNQIGLGNTSSQLNLTSTSILMGTSGTTSATGQISVANSTGNVQITAGTTSILATGIVNAASYTVGTVFTANATMTNTVSLVVSTNTATIGTGTYFVSNGNVGIGTSTPKAPLVITPSTTGTAGTQTLNKIRLFDDGANNVYGFGISVGSMDITSSGTVKIGFNSLTTNTVTNFAQFQAGQLSLTGTDGTSSLLIAGATKGVRTFSNSTATSIEGVDNTGVGSYQPLYVGGSTVSLTTSNVTRATLSSGGIFTIPYQPSFRAYINSAADTTYTLNTILPFNATAFNVGSNFNTTSSLFTAPVAGIYYFHCFTYGTSSGGAATMAIKFYVNGTIVSNSGQNSDMNIGTGSGQVSIAPVAGSIILSLNASDTVGVYCTAYNGTIFRIYTGQSCFEGYLLG